MHGVRRTDDARVRGSSSAVLQLEVLKHAAAGSACEYVLDRHRRMHGLIWWFPLPCNIIVQRKSWLICIALQCSLLHGFRREMRQWQTGRLYFGNAHARVTTSWLSLQQKGNYRTTYFSLGPLCKPMQACTGELAMLAHACMNDGSMS